MIIYKSNSLGLNSWLASGLMAGVLLVMMAKPAVALTIVPPSLEYSVKPGETVKAKIKLFNEGQTATTVFSSVANFTAKGELGDPDFSFTTEPTDTAAWIDAPSGALTIQPNDRIEVMVTINVPKDAEPGGHYASVFFGTDPTIKPQNGGQVTIRSLLGTLIILRVDGVISEQATVASFLPSGGKKTLGRWPATFNFRVENTGNVHLRPQGTLTIKNMFGRPTATVKINDANGAVLPKSIRDYAVTWETVAWAKYKSDELAGITNTDDLAAAEKNLAKPGNFFQEVGREWKNFGLGSYTVTAAATYGTAGKNLTATTKVMIIPWELLLVLVLGLVIVILILVFGFRAYNKAIIRRVQGRIPPTGMKG